MWWGRAKFITIHSATDKGTDGAIYVYAGIAAEKKNLGKLCEINPQLWTNSETIFQLRMKNCKRMEAGDKPHMRRQRKRYQQLTPNWRTCIFTRYANELGLTRKIRVYEVISVSHDLKTKILRSGCSSPTNFLFNLETILQTLHDLYHWAVSVYPLPSRSQQRLKCETCKLTIVTSYILDRRKYNGINKVAK